MFPQGHHANDQIPAQDMESDLREGGQEIDIKSDHGFLKIV